MKKKYWLLSFTICIMQTINAQDHTLFFQVKTKINTNDFPSLCSNKEWDGSEVIDLLSTSNMGLTLASGKKSGWTFFLQPSGAWGWNIGDGANRLDYLPTALQRINDNQWHELGVDFYYNKKTAWLYFDGRHVAIYSLSELDLSNMDMASPIDFTDNKNISIKKEGKENFKNVDAYEQSKPEKLTVMSWNIWHGARHNGIEKGINQAITAIRTSGANLICMQETYGSGPMISDALGTLFYYRSSNLSIHSKFPIVDTYDLFEPFRLGGVRVKMGEQLLDVFSLWIHYLPSISDMYPTAPAEKILSEENKTRGTEIKGILSDLQNAGIAGSEVSLIVAGDFNSPSHLDWGENMRLIHHDYVLEWPVSKSMADFGFTDSFRKLAPVSINSRGFTWSPRFHEAMQKRIDYIYYMGRIKCVNAYVKGYTDSEWPSDHAAVVSEFRFE